MTIMILRSEVESGRGRIVVLLVCMLLQMKWYQRDNDQLSISH